MYKIDKNGFTLIELLAVIIILGILMIVAIPSITKYVSDSRRSSYIDTAQEIVAGARNFVNSRKVKMLSTKTAYYIPNTCIETENAKQSPYGEFVKAYVGVTFDGDKYNYYWTSKDTSNMGIYLKKSDDLTEDDVVSDISDIQLSNIDDRPKLLVLDEETCSKFDDPPVKDTLDNVFATALANNTAKKYTGEHSDSLLGNDEEDIYYFKDGDSNNLIFGNYCWNLVRTTGTGGYKIIYNGEPDSNGQCKNDRGNHVGYDGDGYVYTSSEYAYSDDFTYNAETNTFKLAGNITIASNARGNINQIVGKYTCSSKKVDMECTKLYHVDSIESDTRAKVVVVSNNVPYSIIGKSPFSLSYEIFADIGYMTGTKYPYLSKEYSLSHSGFVTDINMSVSNQYNFYYGDKIKIDNGIYYLLDNNNQHITDPIVWTGTDADNSIVGKYTCRSSSASQTTYNGNSIKYGTRCENVYYVLGIDSSHLFTEYLPKGSSVANSDIVLSKSINNANNIYNLNPSELITIKRYDGAGNWAENFENYVGYYYCSDFSSDCTNSELRQIKSTTKSYLKYTGFYKFSNTFTYSNGTYKLSNDGMFLYNKDANKNEISNAHYTCFNQNGECTDLYYVFYLNEYRFYYIKLSNGENVNDAINKMLVHTTNSRIKTNIDSWFKRNMLVYLDYLEDTVFCNELTVSNYGGWNVNGGNVTSYPSFTQNNSLKCLSQNNMYSLNNSNAKLTYPVGLLTKYEVQLVGTNALKSNASSWLMTPAASWFALSYNYHILTNDSSTSSYYANSSFGVRPVVSLKKGTGFVSGDGSKENPYLVYANPGDIDEEYDYDDYDDYDD